MRKFAPHQMLRKVFRLWLELVFLSGMLSASPVLGQWNLQTIHACGTNGGVAYPYDGVIQGRDGALYGTAVSGATNGGFGGIYKLNPDGSGFKVILEFAPPESPATNPFDAQGTLLQGFDGTLYGLTPSGGANEYGTIFKLDTNGGNFLVIYNFSTNLFESQDLAVGGMWISYSPLLQGADGGLYVTAHNGGSNNAGAIFRLNSDGSGFTILHSFGAFASDGQYPVAALTQGADGVLYGVTEEGGSNFWGTAFELNTNGSGYAVLHHFGGDSDGVVPSARIIQARDGALYGTTRLAGSNATDRSALKGVVFRLNTDGSGYTVLHHFTNSGNIFYGNYSELFQGGDGALYGKSMSGGSTSGGNVFRLNPDGTGYAEIATFPSAGWYGPVPSLGVIQGSDGAWYGTTYNLGSGTGTVFRLALAAPRFSGIHVLPDHGVQLSLAGTSGCTYRIDVSTDLLNWSPFTTLSNLAGITQFSDLGAGAFAQRYYRAVWIP